MPSIAIKKGQSVRLPGASGGRFSAGLGWAAAQDQNKIDLDFWTLRNNNGTWEPVSWVNQLWERPDLGRNGEGNPFIATPEGDVVYKGDDRTGAESDTGYDENVDIDLSKAPAGVTQYAFFATYYSEEVPSPTLGMASSIVCGVTDPSTGNELKVELGDQFPFAVSVLICTVDRQPDGSWHLTSKLDDSNDGYTDGMLDVAEQMGVDLAHWHPNN